MDGHPGPQGLDRTPLTGRLTVNLLLTRFVPATSQLFEAGVNGSMRELERSKRTGELRWELRVFVGRDPDKTVRDPETGSIVKQWPPVHL